MSIMICKKNKPKTKPHNRVGLGRGCWCVVLEDQHSSPISWGFFGPEKGIDCVGISSLFLIPLNFFFFLCGPVQILPSSPEAHSLVMSLSWEASDWHGLVPTVTWFVPLDQWEGWEQPVLAAWESYSYFQSYQVCIETLLIKDNLVILSSRMSLKTAQLNFITDVCSGYVVCCSGNSCCSTAKFWQKKYEFFPAGNYLV